MEEEELQFDFTPVTFFLLLDSDVSGRLRFYPRLQQGMEAVQRDMDRVNYKGDLCGIIGSLVHTPLCSQLN